MKNKKTKSVKSEIRIGDIVAVEFLPNKIEGRKPVCLVNGIVGFINRTYKGPFIETHSVWHVEVAQIDSKSLVVDPVQEIKTAFENIREIKQRLKDLATKHAEKPAKPKVHYPYKNSTQRKAESNGNKTRVD